MIEYSKRLPPPHLLIKTLLTVALLCFSFVSNKSIGTSLSDNLVFEKCSVSVGAQEVDAQCSDFKRLENPEDPKSRILDLSVIKFASRSVNPETDAFTIIQGGPGGSSIDLAVSFSPILESIRAKRDVIVIDQRGTGRSNKLICPEPEDNAHQFDAENIKRETQRCVTQLESVSQNEEGETLASDLRFYTTSVAVDDLEALRIAAGYTQLNIYGVSYGTRVAQHYLRKYPSSVRSMIIDGVAPIGLNLAGSEVAKRWEDSFNRLNERCSQDENCVTTHGDLRESYQTLKKRFSEKKISINLPHPRTGESTEYTFDEYSLFSAIRLMTYNTESLSLMPLLISEAIKGHYTFVAAQILLAEESLGTATGMHNSVICTEDAPFVTEEDIKQAKNTLVGELVSEAVLAGCSVWPKGVLDDDFLKPFESDVPTLILSGETDPVTPAANGEIAAKMLSNSKHIVVPAHGHGVLARGCMPKLASLFIEDAHFESIDETCVKRERAMPIFSTLSGPKS